MKRALDLFASVIGLIVCAPVIAIAMIAIWAQDRHSPFYVSPRAAQGGGTFRMVKLRSMRVGADRTGVASTAGDDRRTTLVGKILRKGKLDELPQLWNVLKGEMSLVGPRPQVVQQTARFTAVERDVFTARPGITDLASIVFADEGEILRGSADPDGRYDALIRPWKSRLALLYVYARPGIATDLRVILLTIRSFFDRSGALRAVSRMVGALGGDETLRRVALREKPLVEVPPPGTPGATLHLERVAP